MLFYFSILFIFGIFSVLEIGGLKKSNLVVLFGILSGLLFFLSFVRWETGTDWAAYYNSFLRPTDIGDFGDYEPLYATINTIISNTVGDYTILLFVLSSILFYFQIKGIYKLSLFPLTSLFILVGIYFGNVNYVRQNIAVCILFYSVSYICNRQFLRFLFMVILASLFHRSSIIFLFAWWIFNMRISKKMMLITVASSILFSSLVSTALASLGEAAGGIINYKLSFYLSDYDVTEGTGFSPLATILKGVLNKCFVLISILLLIDRIKEKYPEVQGYLNLYWFGIILYFACVGVSIVFVRFSFPYDFIQIILIPYIFLAIHRVSNKAFVFCLLSLYLTARLYVYMMSYYELYVPFKTIFFEQ